MPRAWGNEVSAECPSLRAMHGAAPRQRRRLIGPRPYPCADPSRCPPARQRSCWQPGHHPPAQTMLYAVHAGSLGVINAIAVQPSPGHCLPPLLQMHLGRKLRMDVALSLTDHGSECRHNSLCWLSAPPWARVSASGPARRKPRRSSFRDDQAVQGDLGSRTGVELGSPVRWEPRRPS